MNTLMVRTPRKTIYMRVKLDCLDWFSLVWLGYLVSGLGRAKVRDWDKCFVNGGDVPSGELWAGGQGSHVGRLLK